MKELFPRQDDVLLNGVTRAWPDGLYVGTCSWKYDDWRGLLYSDEKRLNHLQEYVRHLDSVEVDQWFWSLFGPDKISLPRANTVSSYAQSVTPDFRFSVKAPNSLTLTHYYKQAKSDDLVENPHFLSPDLFGRFLDTLAPLDAKIGVVMLQFEYLNRQKMPGLGSFLERLADFLDAIDRRVPLAIECRNPNYLKPEFFDFLRGHDLAPVFCQGYYMPPVSELIDTHFDRLATRAVIRLMGPDREKIEAATKLKWDRIIDDRHQELEGVVEQVRRMLAANIEVYVNVNNHYEGSAPRTIQRMAELFLKD